MHHGQECHACLRRMARQANRFVGAGTEAEERIDARVTRLLGQMETGRTSPAMACQVLHIVTEETGDPDPFAAVKHEYNRRALTDELAIDHMDRLVERLRDARNVVYLTDNSGEIVFDRLLLRTVIEGRLRGPNGPGLERIEILVKGSPILNDAMLEDAREVGLDRLPGVVLRELAVGPSSPTCWLGPTWSSPRGRATSRTSVNWPASSSFSWPSARRWRATSKSPKGR